MFSLVWSLTCRFWSTYSSISALAACDANFGSTESKDTSTRRLPRTGSTLTRPMNALDQRRFVGRRAGLRRLGRRRLLAPQHREEALPEIFRQRHRRRRRRQRAVELRHLAEVQLGDHAPREVAALENLVLRLVVGLGIFVELLGGRRCREWPSCARSRSGGVPARGSAGCSSTPESSSRPSSARRRRSRCAGSGRAPRCGRAGGRRCPA